MGESGQFNVEVLTPTVTLIEILIDGECWSWVERAQWQVMLARARARLGDRKGWRMVDGGIDRGETGPKPVRHVILVPCRFGGCLLGASGRHGFWNPTRGLCNANYPAGLVSPASSSPRFPPGRRQGSRPTC